DLALTVMVTVLAIWGIWWTREYWRNSPGVQKDRRLWELWLGSRCLVDGFLRVLPAANLSTILVAAAFWCYLAFQVTQGSAISSMFHYATFALIILASLCVIVLAPLLFLFNRPAWLVAPRNRGKPGALNLRGRRGEHRG